MQKTLPLRLIKGFLALSFSLLVLFLFTYIPGRMNLLQHSRELFDWYLFPTKLARVNIDELLGNQLVALLEILFFGIICISFGLFLLQLLHIANKFKISSLSNWLSYLGTAFLLGQGTLALCFILLGGYTSLHPYSTVPLLAICFLVGIRSLLILGKSVNIQSLKPAIKGFTLSEKLLLGISIGAILALMFLSTSRLSYDAVAVYFSDAKLTALSGKLEFFQFRKYLVSNFQTGAVFSVLIQFFGDRTARMFSWVSALIIVILSLSIAQKAGLSKRAKLILLPMLLTTTAWTDLAGDGKVELNSTAFMLAFIYWLVVSISSSPKKSFYFLAGLFAGFAVISRPYNIPLLGAFIGLYYLWAILSSRKEERILLPKNYLPFIWIGLGLLPLLGFYFFANALLTGSALTPIQSTQQITRQNWQWSFFDQQYLWFAKLFYPLLMTYVNTPQSLGNISPLVLASLPLVFSKRIRQRFPKTAILIRLSLVALLVLIIWILATYLIFEIRYIFFLWIILYMPVAAIIASAPDFGKFRLRVFIDIVLIGMLIFSAIRTLYIAIDSYSPVDQSGEPRCYDMAFCELVRPVNTYASPGDRVLTLNAYRYYLRPDLFACSTRAEEYDVLAGLSHQTPDAFWSEVVRQGYEFIIYESNFSTRHLRLGMDLSATNLPPWITLKILYIEPHGVGYVYQIHTEHPPVDVEKSCSQNESGIWQTKTINE